MRSAGRIERVKRNGWVKFFAGMLVGAFYVYLFTSHQEAPDMKELLPEEFKEFLKLRAVNETLPLCSFFWPTIHNREQLPTFLNQRNLDGFGVEIGVHRGNFSDVILSAWRGKKLYMVDTWDGTDVYEKEARQKDKEQAKRSVERFTDRYELVVGYSHEVAKKFPNDFFDFIYLDATHRYIDAMQDLQAWFPKLKIGGMLAGHDYTSDEIPRVYHFTVKEAVDKFAFSNGLHVHMTRDLDTLFKNPSFYLFKCRYNAADVPKENVQFESIHNLIV